VERALSVIGARLQRESRLARPFWCWGYVAKATLALAVLGFRALRARNRDLLAAPEFPDRIPADGSGGGFRGSPGRLDLAVFRGTRTSILTTTLFAIGVSVRIAVFLSELLTDAIRFF